MLIPSIYLTYQTTAKTGVKLSLVSQNLPLLVMIETGLKQKHQSAVRATEETWLRGLWIVLSSINWEINHTKSGTDTEVEKMWLKTFSVTLKNFLKYLWL